jgi:hypothetical protein
VHLSSRALVAGLLALGLLMRHWWFPFVCLLVFAACVAAVPQGVDRVSAMGEISDGSISNRLTLWGGTLATTNQSCTTKD